MKSKFLRILGVLIFMSFYQQSFAQNSEVKRSDLYSRGIENNTFIKKGQWLTGATFNYSEHANDNYKFLILEDWSGKGYNFQVSPFVAYFLNDNFSIGGRFTYNRSLLDIDELNLKIGDDLSMSINGAHYLSHTFYSTFFIRNYLSLGKSNRFGLFNEVRLSYGYGQSKEMTIGQTPAETQGIYSVINEFNIGVAPGLVAFINDNVALEASIGLIGFSNKWTKQVENQVEEGERRVSKANFNIDIFSLNIGLAFYL
ncbi:hypothetical protein [Flammeovirga sp. EKP202]|uniref:hypothetical protein n=1 Tax=Flammeovirga sp. EKP202 TaxID=2770592 RepID=UPI00165F4B85|nr:hypothetical protein [Flammeovirga sp. EKP202]MBD0405469.1 hypothetical protein [Flammeovirga sp. EKP202]